MKRILLLGLTSNLLLAAIDVNVGLGAEGATSGYSTDVYLDCTQDYRFGSFKYKTAMGISLGLGAQGVFGVRDQSDKLENMNSLYARFSLEDNAISVYHTSHVRNSEVHPFFRTYLGFSYQRRIEKGSPYWIEAKIRFKTGEAYFGGSRYNPSTQKVESVSGEQGKDAVFAVAFKRDMFVYDD